MFVRRKTYTLRRGQESHVRTERRVLRPPVNSLGWNVDIPFHWVILTKSTAIYLVHSPHEVKTGRKLFPATFGALRFLS
jgi:hypothetical protein